MRQNDRPEAIQVFKPSPSLRLKIFVSLNSENILHSCMYPKRGLLLKSFQSTVEAEILVGIKFCKF